jgi:hypothetical protein
MGCAEPRVVRMVALGGRMRGYAEPRVIMVALGEKRGEDVQSLGQKEWWLMAERRMGGG